MGYGSTCFMLSATDCFYDSDGNFSPYDTVRIGHIGTDDGTQYTVDCVSIHPDYADAANSLWADVAIVKLTSAVEGCPTVSLNKDTSYPSAGTDLTGAKKVSFGWLLCHLFCS